MTLHDRLKKRDRKIRIMRSALKTIFAFTGTNQTENGGRAIAATRNAHQWAKEALDAARR